MKTPCTVTASTTIPGAPVEGDAHFFRVVAGNAVELAGLCTAGAGHVYLMYWDDDADETGAPHAAWYPVDNDAQDLKALQVDATKPAAGPTGLFSDTWMTGDTAQRWFCVLVTGGATISPLRAFSRRL